ncbi:Uncharacterised protein [Pseudomonas fluorescens]|uniref:Uncharacterized protein n=2 Tax=Pseudomonas fluorescens TaxID=294 RepID=A0A448DYI8_PSEFL|nr:Uncharacterised protein [Pseudomonas fluorescens]
MSMIRQAATPFSAELQALTLSCKTERMLAHGYALQLMALREDLVAQRKLCSTHMAIFRLLLSVKVKQKSENPTRLVGW